MAKGGRGGRGAAGAQNTRGGDRSGRTTDRNGRNQSQQQQGHSRDGHNNRHADDSRTFGSNKHNANAASAGASSRKDEEMKAAGDQSWLFDGDNALEGTLEDVAHRVGVSLDDPDSFDSGPTPVIPIDGPTSKSHSKDHGHPREAMRSDAGDWRKKDPARQPTSDRYVAPHERDRHAHGNAHIDRNSNPFGSHERHVPHAEAAHKPRASRHEVASASTAAETPAQQPAHSAAPVQPTSAHMAARNTVQEPVAAPPASHSAVPVANLDSLWWYVDSKNQIQGPFTGTKMNMWLTYFNPELSVGNGPSGPWTPLADRFSHNINPFDGLPLSSSPATEFKKKLEVYRASKSTPHAGASPFVVPQHQPAHQAVIHTSPQLQTQVPPQTTQAAQAATISKPAAAPVAPATVAAPAAQKGNQLTLDALFGSAGSAAAQPQQPQNFWPMPAYGQHPQNAYNQQQFNNLYQQQQFIQQQQLQQQQAAQQSQQQAQQHASQQQKIQPAAIWGTAAQPQAVQPQQQHALSFRELQEQEKARPATQPQAQPVPVAQPTAPRTADTQSLFALHFGSNETQQGQSAAAAPVAQPAPVAVAQPARQASPAPGTPSQTSEPKVIANTPKTSVNDLFDSARTVPRVVPPAVVVPKGPTMHEIQQEELKRAQEEKVAEEKRREEAKKAAEAQQQRTSWAESAAKAPAPSNNKSTKGLSMREIQEEQERELSSQRQRQAESRAAAQAAAPRTPTFNGVWGSTAAAPAASNSKPSLRDIQQQEAQAAAPLSLESFPALAAPAKKTSWAATTAPAASSIRQISAEQQGSAQRAPQAAPAPAAEEEGNIWDDPEENSGKSATAASPAPKAGAAKKKVAKKVLQV